MELIETRKVSSKKTKWNNTPTKSIRVPQIMANNLLNIARSLDTLPLELITDLTIKFHREIATYKEKLEPKEAPKIQILPTETDIPKVVKSEKPTKLTPSQQAAFDQLKQFIEGKLKYFRLTGYAGTGKSFLICKFIRWLLAEGYDVTAAAPTNKAAKNLTKIAQENHIKIEATTIAKLLGQQPELSKESGKEEFTSIREPHVEGIVILDEYSMINKSNFEQLITEAKKNKHTKLIFVGDAAQLPPVGEDEPVVQNSPLIQESATLEEVVRYDGEIGKVAETIRDGKYTYRVYPFTSTTDKTIITMEKEEWMESAAAHFKCLKFQQDSDYSRILVWRNRTADALNDWVREQLWGENCPAFCKGDRLIAKKPVFRPSPSKKNGEDIDWAIEMNNSEECVVTEEAILNQTVTGWQYWEVLTKSDDKKEITLKILTPEAEKMRQQHIEAYKQKKQYEQMINLDKSYDHIAFAYALTTHKAQGSSINHVFMDVKDMKISNDRQKLIYTALTRAKSRAYILI